MEQAAVKIFLATESEKPSHNKGSNEEAMRIKLYNMQLFHKENTKKR